MKKIPFILTMLVLLLKLEVIAKKYSFSSDSLELENKTYLEEKTKLCLPSQENYFEENKGQITGKDASEVNFVHKSGNVSMFLMGSSIAYQFTKVHYPKGYEPIDKYSTLEEYKEIGKLEKKVRIETYRMDLVLENCNSKIEITTKGKSKDYIQYYNHDALDVHQYEEVTYHNVYPNIDWKFYKRGENIKYDFIVHPGGDPTQIKLKRKWGTDIKILTNGNIVFSTPMGSITENKPISFQEGREVNTQFLLENQNVSFSLSNYDVNQVLYIDPTVIWASYYGGSENEQGSETCVDKNNNVYLSGRSPSLTNIAQGGYQNTYGGGYDAFIVKFNSDGVRQWASYYGGSQIETGFNLAVDESNNVYMTGTTRSLSNISMLGHQNNYGGNTDCYIVKFDSLGIRKWASYYGGNESDIVRGLAIDTSNNVYLSGTTQSMTSIAQGGHQNMHGGGLVNGPTDAFIVKFDSLGVRQWATYYGGSGNDSAGDIAIDGNVNIYLVGNTGSSNNIAVGGHQNNYNNNDAFIVKFNSNGVRQWGSYYGGSDSDSGLDLAIDVHNNLYMVGYTKSISNIAFGGFQNTYGGGDWDAFIVKFNAGGVREWSSYYGGNDSDLGYTLAIDGNNNVYLSGSTNSISGIASGGYQNTYGGGYWDAFVVKLNSVGTRKWASYYGGSGNDSGDDLAIDENDNIYLVGDTRSFEGIAYGGHQNTAGGGGLTDCYIAKLSSNCFTLPGSDNQIACGSYTWIDGNTYTSSNNTATHTLSTLNSCDSLVMLNLIINNTTFGIDTQVSCESYTWIDGITYTSSNNTAEYTLIGSNGCDSIVNLNLTINVPTTFTDIQTSCDSYTWIDGVTYTSSNNTAVHTLTGVNGCDSIIYLKLTINNTTIGTDYQTACESYTWIDGNTYTSSNNTATYTLVNSAGCDSIITLNLSILPSLSSTDSVQACDSIVWIDGITYTTSNFTATNTLTSSTGCDSIITLNLIIYDTLDVSISYNRDSLFCTIGDSYQWFYNGVFIVGANNQWFIPLENGLYTVEVITSNGCNSSGDFNLNNVGVDSEHIKLSIFPNPVQELLYINANKRINYELYDTLGKLVVRSKLRVNSHVINTLSYEKGVYILRLKGEDNSQMIKRVILH